MSEKQKYDLACFIIEHGGIDGAHHKQWVLDQVLRRLMGEMAYGVWYASIDPESGEDWDQGVAP